MAQTEHLPVPETTSAENYVKAILDAQGVSYSLAEPARGGMIETPERWQISSPLKVPVQWLLPIKSQLGRATENEIERHVRTHGTHLPITLHSIYLLSWVEFEVPRTT